MILGLTKKIHQEKGVIIIIASLTLTLLLILSSYFLSFVVAESKISNSQVVATQAYYLAEAGVHEAIWKLKNDPDWQNGFQDSPDCHDWSADFSRNDILIPNSSYQVQIQNSSCARGQIISLAKINLADGRIVQRELRVKVFKSIGSLTKNSAVLSGGTSENINVNFSDIDVYDGNFSCNNNLTTLLSIINIHDNPLTTDILEGKVLVANNIQSIISSIGGTGVCSKNICSGDCSEGCPPSDLADMPSIDFDSASPGSYYNKAQSFEDNNQCSVLCNGVQCDNNCIFTKSEFEDLLWQIGQGGTLILNNGITYVTGPIDLKGERKIVVNGILVADGTINIGEKNCWTRQGDKDCGYNQITVNDPGENEPSGILSKSKINFGSYSGYQDINIDGLVYSCDEMKLVSIPHIFEITGGLLARKISFTSVWATINIYLDNTIIAEGVWGGAEPPSGTELPYSPIITIEHWEEAY
ncbi:hypothetical protein KKA72_02425 [Patescibacteria group bacterium]|nr:hypothetical protein [Patescibacteria group bacterium]MBU1877173.1 hypothetical protein [Patescibacteria group bacterium]